MKKRSARRRSGPIRVLVADDHPVVREGLAALINRRRDMKVVSEAVNGQQACEEFLRHHPDVALLDLRMPQMGGLEAMRAIHQKQPKARVIILSTYGGEEDVYRAIRAGAKAYLLKDCPREQLLEAIREVHAGRTFILPTLAVRLAAQLTRPHLTGRQMEVLQILVTGKSNKEIAAQLGITEGTVKLHVNQIFKKVGAGSRAEAITVALREGIVHLTEPYFAL
ncbi:MAG TPA: response regulator transcription factor [Terriglobales bacterium]|nr:response regulator transcription factor [Terriglobales bacterium]